MCLIRHILLCMTVVQVSLLIAVGQLMLSWVAKLLCLVEVNCVWLDCLKLNLAGPKLMCSVGKKNTLPPGCLEPHHQFCLVRLTRYRPYKALLLANSACHRDASVEIATCPLLAGNEKEHVRSVALLDFLATCTLIMLFRGNSHTPLRNVSGTIRFISYRCF
jgi:hypothetical protein